MADPKAILVLGPRQTGKSTLLKEIAGNATGKSLLLNCDEALSREVLQNIRSTAELRLLIGNARLVLIDEAQRVHDRCIFLPGHTQTRIAEQFAESACRYGGQ